jgi:hypothetical protein
VLKESLQRLGVVLVTPFRTAERVWARDLWHRRSRLLVDGQLCFQLTTQSNGKRMQQTQRHCGLRSGSSLIPGRLW